MNFKKLTIILLTIGFIITAILVYTISYDRKSTSIEAINGEIDLTNTNLSELNNPIKLDGNWNFFYNQLLYPEASNENKESYLEVPGGWQKTYPVFGYATYRLELKINKTMVDEITFKIPIIQSEYIVWIDEIEVARRGNLEHNVKDKSLTQQTNVGQRISIVTIRPKSDTISIVVWASNKSEEKSGIITSFQIGSQKTIINNNVRHWIFISIVLGCLVAVGTYSMILYLFRRKETQYLYFSLINYSYFIRYSFAFVEVDNFLYPDIQTELKTLIANVAVAIFLYVSVIFLMEVANIVYKQLQKIFLAMLLSYLFLLIFHINYNNILFLYAKVFPIAVAICLIIVVGLVYRNVKDKVIRIYIIGFYGYIAFAIFEVVGFDKLLYPSLPASLYMIFCQAIVLAYSHNKAYREVENMNITLEKLVEERTNELVQEMQKTDQFIAEITHDLRTPITAISGYLQLVDATRQADETTKTYIGSALKRAAQLNRLVEDLFLSTKITNKILKLDLEVLEVNQILEEYQNNFLNRFDSPIKISFHHLNKRVYIKTDRNKLYQILDNLIQNGLEYAKTNIKVECKLNKQIVIFSVTDDGSGIKTDEIDKIFNKGYSQRENGTGLGLHIVKKLVKYMGGEINVTSEQGRGSKFYFALKKYEEE